MNPETQQDETLGRALRDALPASPTSPALRERVAQMTAQSQPARRRPVTRRARFAWSALAVACALAIFAVVWPRVLTTQALAQIESAMENVSSAHLTAYQIEDGKRILSNETWYQSGKWRMQNHQSGAVTLWISGKLWAYDPVSNVVTTTNKNSPFAHPPKGFTLDALVAEFSDNGQQTDVTLLGNSTLDGKTVKRVRLLSRSIIETTDMTLLVDPQTNLPIRADALIKSSGGGRGRVQVDFEFNQPLAPSLFEPKFKRGARFVEQARQQGSIMARLNAGIARRKVGERTIVVRDLAVNPRGDVFLLYTAGKRRNDRFKVKDNWFNGRDWKVYLTDSLGTRYHFQRGSQYESQYIEGMRQPPPLFDGQVLQGDWWVPDVAPAVGQKWRPRSFTLRFEVSPRDLHGAQGITFETDYSATADFQVPVSQTTEALVPPPAQAIGLNLSDDQILHAEGEERGELPPGTLPSPELERVLIEGEDTYDLQFSPDASQIVTGGDGGARLFEAQSGRLLKQWRGPQGSHADEIVWAPDGQTLGAAFTTRDYKPLQFVVWDAQSQAQRANWKWDLSADESLASLAIAPDNRTLRVVIRRITRRHNDPKAGEIVDEMNVEIQERELLTGAVKARRALPSEGFVLGVVQAEINGRWWLATLQDISGSRLRLLTRWDGATGARKFTENVSDLNGRGLAMAAGRVAVNGQVRPLRADGSGNGDARPTGSEVRTYAVDADKGLADFPTTTNGFGGPIALAADGSRIAFEDAGHAISVRDVQSGRTLQTLVGHYSGISHLAFSPDGQRLVSADSKGKVLEWKLN